MSVTDLKGLVCFQICLEDLWSQFSTPLCESAPILRKKCWMICNGPNAVTIQKCTVIQTVWNKKYTTCKRLWLVNILYKINECNEKQLKNNRKQFEN